MAARWVRVERTTRCRRCGERNVAWLQSKKGKWYLAEIRRVDGYIEANRASLHSCPTVEQSIPPFDPLMEKIITSGYRVIARELHPDRGGSTIEMQKLNLTVEALRQLVRMLEAVATK